MTDDQVAALIKQHISDPKSAPFRNLEFRDFRMTEMKECFESLLEAQLPENDPPITDCHLSDLKQIFQPLLGKPSPENDRLIVECHISDLKGLFTPLWEDPRTDKALDPDFTGTRFVRCSFVGKVTVLRLQRRSRRKNDFSLPPEFLDGEEVAIVDAPAVRRFAVPRNADAITDRHRNLPLLKHLKMLRVAAPSASFCFGSVMASSASPRSLRRSRMPPRLGLPTRQPFGIPVWRRPPSSPSCRQPGRNAEPSRTSHRGHVPG